MHGLCHLLSPFIAKRGQKYALPPPSMKLYWCEGSLGMYTLLLVCTGMWLVESMSWVCMLMGEGGGHSCVCWECTLMLGGEKCYLVCWVSTIEF